MQSIDLPRMQSLNRQTPGALCVSLHDVAPQTWPLCRRLLQAIHAVADIPLTLLVVPDWHGNGGAPDAAYAGMLEAQLARGHELALHGYTHLDQGPPPAGWRERYLRRVYTLSEGEFAALGSDQAAERLARGCAWFDRHGWPLHGFVAPAWLLGPGTWRALQRFPFEYTTTMTRFHCLRQGSSVFAPSLVYSSRNEWGRACSRAGNTVAARLMNGMPLLRLGLHPRDAESLPVVAHMQRLLEKLLAARRPCTKAAFAAAWQPAPEVQDTSDKPAGMTARGPIIND
jgi:predicted deacetylase